MAKTIKFSLICDGHPVRTIEELQNNFSIEDILSYFKSGLLERWLDVRGYDEEKLQVSKIDKSLDKLQQISELIKIFKVESDDNEINKGIYNLNYEERKRSDLVKYEKSDFKVKEVVSDYFSDYDALIKQIVKEPTNAPLIKVNVKAILEDYENIFNKDFRDLFNRLIDQSPLAVLHLLSHKKARLKYLPITETLTINGKTIVGSDLTHNSDKAKMYEKIKKFFYKMYNTGEIYGVTDQAITALGTELKIYKKFTDGYFYSVEPHDKKIMVIYMSRDVKIISPINSYKKDPFDYNINAKFEILDGIQFSSKDDTYNTLYYMEV